MLPDNLVKQFYLSEIDKKVIPRNIHFDPTSVERSTNIIKPKYVLLTRRNLELGIFLFYALTSRESSCPERAKIKISYSDYETRDLKYLKKPLSFINLEKVAVESLDEIILKMRNPRNGFPTVAVIRQLKFNELKSHAVDFKQSSFVTDETTRKIIMSALHEGDISTEFVTKFGI